MLPASTPIVTHDGIRGVITPDAWLSGTEQEEIVVTFADGGQHVVPTSALEARISGGYWLNLTQEQLIKIGVNVERSRLENDAPVTDELVIPIIEESADIRIERVPTGRVRIQKTVETRQEQVQETLYDEQVKIERHPVNREVEAPVAVRYDGDTMIISVIEETLVVQKRYVVKEEIHVTTLQVAHHDPQTFTLRRENVFVERLDAEQTPNVNPTTQKQEGESR